jgi:glycosyltransferase involved in cell wall biosynthesis
MAIEDKPNITVVLLTRNRNFFAAQALKSLVDQDFSNFNLLISDNSDDGSFESIVTQICSSFINFTYVKRSPPLSSEDHFKLVLREIDSDFFLLFHDDDVARPSFISSLFTFINRNPEIAAVASNGVKNNNGKVESKGLFFSNGEVVKISTAEDLILRYFSLDGHGCAPFPSYMYRSEVIPYFLALKNLLGKHNDFLWLVTLFSIGSIAWLPQKLLEYRVHSLSDSAQESLKDRLSILAYLKKKYPKTVDRYRFIFYLLITAKHYNNSLLKNFYLGKPAVKHFICKQFTKELMTGSMAAWVSYKVKNLIHK